MFPHSRALDEGGLEEERRLCYVGITRAQRDLYLTYARTRNVFGARNFGAPSRFISEIPAELTDREQQQPRGLAGIRARATSWARSSGDDDGPSWDAPRGAGRARVPARRGRHPPEVRRGRGDRPRARRHRGHPLQPRRLGAQDGRRPGADHAAVGGRVIPRVPQHERDDHRRQGSGGAGPRRGGARRRRAARADRPGARPGHDPGRRRSGLGGLRRATSARPAPRRASPTTTSICRPTRPRRTSRR